jgi:tripartite ATP-independent transporter DctM subunit
MVRESVNWREKIVSLKSLLPLTVIFMFAIGGIFFGIFTPTEGGAMGAGGALLVAVIMRRLRWKAFTFSLKESGIITGMVFVAILGGFVFSRMLVLGGVVEAVAGFIVRLPVDRHVIFLLITVLYIILGMIMQSLVIMVITVPVLMPTVIALGYDPIWFGIMFVRLAEMAVITPPVAVNLYVVKGVLGDQVSLVDIMRGTLWFLVADASNLVLLYLFPQITLWLPTKMWG